jgi:hypothetical protein
MTNTPISIGTCAGFPLNLSNFGLQEDVDLHYQIRVADVRKWYISSCTTKIGTI